MTLGFEVERIDDVALDGPEELLAKNLMSPFVWRIEGDAGLLILVRAVPPDKGDDGESGRIWYGRSGSDGLTFRMDAGPIMVPTSGAHDSMGCEDPTVVRTDDGYVVFYTGVDADKKGHLLYATGADMRSLKKQGIALPNSKSEQNSKEATLLRADDRWQLLYEYSHDGHSLISLTDGDGADGPWHEQPDPFSPREGKWDGWHLSTGPLLRSDSERPVMFYNGATEDAEWGIGWVALSPDLRTVVARGDEPLIAPPPHPSGPRDISFAASVVDTEGTIWLYYSRNDRELKRATIRQTG